MANRKPEPVFEPCRGVFEQGTRTADESAETVQLVSSQLFIRIEEEFEQSRHDTDARHPFMCAISARTWRS